MAESGSGNGNGGAPPPEPGTDQFISDEQYATLKKAAQDSLSSIFPPAELLKQLQTNRGELNVATILWLVKNLSTFLRQVVKEVSKTSEPVIRELVGDVTNVITAFVEPFAAASAEYTKAVAKEMGGRVADARDNAGEPEGFGAQYAFDSIVAPIAHITSGVPPTQDRAGSQNIQAALGSIVELHLITWVVNIVSNLTGVGTLKLFNSFTEVLLSALNARGLSRVAMKPYLTTFMVDPATAELNTQYTPKFLSEGQAVRGYMRGLFDSEAAKSNIKAAGFRDKWSEELFLAELKVPGDSQIGKMVNLRWIDSDKAVAWLKLNGWTDETINVVYHFNRLTDVFSILRDTAARIEAQFLQGQITEEQFRDILHELMFSDEEIEALVIKVAATPKKQKRLSFGDVRRLYEASLVDLNFVEDYLTSEGYTTEDAHLLMLLDFTTLTARKQREDLLAAEFRLKAAKLQEEATVAINKNELAIAAAEQALAKKAAALAKSFGG